MTLEDIGAVEALLRGGAGSRAEIAHHGTLIVCQGVPVLVVLACEAFLVILARNDWTFLRSLRLMGQHMSLQIFEYSSTVRVWASASFSAIIVESDACRS